MIKTFSYCFWGVCLFVAFRNFFLNDCVPVRDKRNYFSDCLITHPIYGPVTKTLTAKFDC